MFLPVKSKVCLVQAIILPILDYADFCFLDPAEGLLNKLERFLYTIHFVLRMYEHIFPFRAQLKWLLIPFRRNVRIFCLLFKTLSTSASSNYVSQRISLLRSSGFPGNFYIGSLHDLLLFVQ